LGVLSTKQVKAEVILYQRCIVTDIAEKTCIGATFMSLALFVEK